MIPESLGDICLWLPRGLGELKEAAQMMRAPWQAALVISLVCPADGTSNPVP